MQELEELFNLVDKKHKIDVKRGEVKYLDIDWALDEIVSEVQEVKEEVKPNNMPYLEDELGDIFWGWLVAVEKLKDKGYVRGHKEIIKRALKKYKERVEPLQCEMPQDVIIWREVKAKQKEALAKEQKEIDKRLFDGQ